jgi:hypothetical protein
VSVASSESRAQGLAQGRWHMAFNERWSASVSIDEAELTGWRPEGRPYEERRLRDVRY